MLPDRGPVIVREQAGKNPEYWCRQLVSVCYVMIAINLLVLIAVWYFFAFGKEGHDIVGYWTSFIIVPSSIMLIANVGTDLLIRSNRITLGAKEHLSILLPLFFCAFLCVQHNIVAVLLTSFTVPVMLSTLYANTRMTKLTYLLAQVLLVLSSVQMHFNSTRDFDSWIYVEAITASGILLASYFMARILIVYGKDNIVSFDRMRKGKMELEEELKLDPLTGLYNRKAYDEQLPLMMEECRKSQRDLSLAMLDIDDFKQVNDTYGHAAGDRVLLRVAALLRQVMNEQTGAFRIGGEEFILLFQGCSVSKAVKTCEDALAAIRAETLRELEDVRITLSCGVAGMRENETDPLELFKAADAALYVAKNSGKNKVVARSSSPE